MSGRCCVNRCQRRTSSIGPDQGVVCYGTSRVRKRSRRPTRYLDTMDGAVRRYMKKRKKYKDLMVAGQQVLLFDYVSLHVVVVGKKM